MRTTVEQQWSGPVNWSALRPHRRFLYRRMADEGREVLGVGLLLEADRPRFLQGKVSDWWFGHLAYEFDPAGERDRVAPPHDRGLPLAQWWVPRWVFEWREGRVVLHAFANDLAAGLALLSELREYHPSTRQTDAPVHLLLRTDREEYLRRVQQLKAHIQRGDIYEVNFCITREGRSPEMDPFQAFGALLRNTDAAFAGFLRCNDHMALCASPERFLTFKADKVWSQPMKGTRPRHADAAEDERLARELAGDPKERSENIMAVDVVRHDLSRVAAKASVVVEELCAVRPHARVHQMTSTVAARLAPGKDPWDAVCAAFPMASMTGAPKQRAMQLIDQLEDGPRGLFSGSLGFFAPDGTGDLNVVIRTLLHTVGTGLTTLSTGSALTAACDPAQEWMECELKAHSVLAALWT